MHQRLGKMLGLWLLKVSTSGRMRWPTWVPPSFYGLAYEEVVFPASDGVELSGWLTPRHGARGVVLLCHGINSTRMSMVRKARWLHEWGYTTLLFDFRGRGQSGGCCSLGGQEPLDVVGALDYLNSRPELRHLPIGGLAESLGAASMLGAMRADGRIQAAVLEACFTTMEEAVAHRCRLFTGPWAPRVLPWVLLQLQPFDIGRVSPLHHIGQVRSNLLLIHDELDWGVPLSATRRLRDQAAGPTELWIAPWSLHVRASCMARTGYQTRVREFFQRCL